MIHPPKFVRDTYHWSSSDDETLRKLWSEGLRTKELVEVMRFSKSIINYRIKALGLRSRGECGERKQVIESYGKLRSVSKVARDVGTSEYHVRRHLRCEGLII